MYSLIPHGRRLIELQKRLNLRFEVNLFLNSFSFVSATDVRKEQNFTDSYLVDSLGLTSKLAESISRKVSAEANKGNPESVLSLLRCYGFTDSQISTIITIYPRLLIADADNSLAPKLKFLHSRGASSSELTEILSKVPKLLGIKKDRAISVYYDFVKDIIEADKSSKYVKLCHSLPEGSMQANKIRNISVLRELGVPQRLLFSLLVSDYRPVHGKERFEESLKKIVEMGFDPTTSKFVEALRIVQGLSDKTIEEKVQVYKSLGFTVENIWGIFKHTPAFLKFSKKKILNSIETFLSLGFSRDEFVMMVKLYPACIGRSAEAVKKKTEFLVKKMNWPLKAVVSIPQVISYSMEKRIIPRCNVIKALMSKGLIGTELPPMRSVLLDKDQVFLKRYVMKNNDKELVAELMAIFTKDCVS